MNYIKLLTKGVDAWNRWRNDNPDAKIELYGVDLKGSSLKNVNLKGVNLNKSKFCGANLKGANFSLTKIMMADFSEANLEKANFNDAKLSRAKFCRANFKGANLSGANLYESDFSGTNLIDAHLYRAAFIRTNLSGANLTGCKIYGISAWDVNLYESIQSNLVISRNNTPLVTVDNIAVAQFIYLLLHNKEIRSIIDTLTSKVILILGSFLPHRKNVLEAVRNKIRENNYIPILFDFEKPYTRDTLETISTLAHMARFVIADLTNAKSVLQELQHIVPNLPSVPVKPILYVKEHEPGMLDHFRQYRTFLKVYLYKSTEELISTFNNNVLLPAVSAYDQIHRFNEYENCI